MKKENGELIVGDFISRMTKLKYFEDLFIDEEVGFIMGEYHSNKKEI
jgi:hypothetical protein